MNSQRTRAARSKWLLLFVLLSITVVTVGAVTKQPGSERELNAPENLELMSAKPQADSHNYSVSIHQPAGPPRVTTGVRDLHGDLVTVSCSACHATRQPNRQNQTTQDLDEFHGGMKFSHGTISCLACHNEHDYDALKLANGTRIEFTDVMSLCGQCHGPQRKAFKHGAHGGVNGYWDRSRGPQMKNNCVDCHNPHTPQFPQMQPTFKPKDRFLDQAKGNH